MKTIILCGGFGTRISEYTKTVPKPMIKIGQKPILMHIIDTFKKYEFNDFYLNLGYKKKVIYDYFSISSKYKKEQIQYKNRLYMGCFYNKNCRIHLIVTGINTMTGGRLKRLSNFIEDNNFFLTYGDGLANVNLHKLLRYHYRYNKIATVTAVVPPARFGAMMLNKKNIVSKFSEKNHISDNWINGGYFVFSKKIFKFLENDSTILEQSPLRDLAKKKQLIAYKHKDFWQCMDTVRDRENLNKLNTFKLKPWLI